MFKIDGKSKKGKGKKRKITKQTPKSSDVDAAESTSATLADALSESNLASTDTHLDAGAASQEDAMALKTKDLAKADVHTGAISQEGTMMLTPAVTPTPAIMLDGINPAEWDFGTAEEDVCEFSEDFVQKYFNLDEFHSAPPATPGSSTWASTPSGPSSPFLNNDTFTTGDSSRKRSPDSPPPSIPPSRRRRARRNSQLEVQPSTEGQDLNPTVNRVNPASIVKHSRGSSSRGSSSRHS